jgi:hypothetical protein
MAGRAAARIADSLIDRDVNSGPQQQWISRSTQWGSWTAATGTWCLSDSHEPSGRDVARHTQHVFAKIGGDWRDRRVLVVPVN